MPMPRIDVRNASVQRLEVKDLQPFTDYSVTITACTGGGCTESQPTLIQTRASIPSNQRPPVATVHSKSYVSLLWTLPGKPNGPNLRYELSRRKIRQPLEPSAIIFNVWSSVYSGNMTFYQDRGLDTYTTYQYRVTSFNDVGHVISDPGDDVTTFGGQPRIPPNLTASQLNQSALLVSWTLPSVLSMRGHPVSFTVNATDGRGLQTILQFGADDSSGHVTGLLPSTRYALTLTMTIYGGAAIQTTTVYANTAEGNPSALAAPEFTVTSLTSLHVTWNPPSISNGEIVSYEVYVDGISQNLTTLTTSHSLENLQPSTLYLIQLEACNLYACTKSDVTRATTAESIPTDLDPPTLTSTSPSTVRIQWTAPGQPNGIVLRYELLRRAFLRCDRSGNRTASGVAGLCSYVRCPLNDDFCGSSCATSSQTCCQGTVYTTQSGYECCGDAYIVQRSSPNEVCCGGRFHANQPGFQCCSGRYIHVGPGQRCCKDPNEDRVTVDYGDRCCRSVPYTANGAQICCNGRLYSGYRRQCCGDLLVSAQMTCCGDADRGAPYQPDSNSFCCGTQYVSVERAVCCRSNDGVSKAHLYSSELDKRTSNQKCCGLERINNHLSCCNSNPYNPITQTCSDKSPAQSNCGSGRVCPIEQLDSAQCDMCRFDSSVYKCGSYTNEQTSASSPDSANPPRCWTNAALVYSGERLSFEDSDLLPFTRYEYSLLAVNGAGSVATAFQSTTTLESRPAGVAPPRARVDPDRPDVIELEWIPPSEPNGIITSYNLFRDGIILLRDPTALSHTDNNGIQPYRTYRFWLQACTAVGCTRSSEIQVATLQSVPGDFAAPSVSTVNSTSIRIAWAEPGNPNGIITGYVIYLLHSVGNSSQSLNTVGSQVTSFIQTGLRPFTYNRFVVGVCTAAGCTNSSEVGGYTAMDRPAEVRAPMVIIVNSSVIELLWRPPVRPNGYLSAYTLYTSTGTDNQPITILAQLPPDVTNLTVSQLQPTRTYTYRLSAHTTAGATNSSDVTVTLPSATPADIPPTDNLTALSSTQLYVSWPPVSGLVDQVRVLLTYDAAEFSFSVPPDRTNHTLSGLHAYTLYAVRIQACLRGVFSGCGTSQSQYVRTFPAAPVDQSPPELTSRGPGRVTVQWRPPASTNGPIVHYLINRTDNPGITSSGTLVATVLPGSVLRYDDQDPDLTPYTEYYYRITTVNTVGMVTSQWTAIRTGESPPRTLQIPLFSNIGAQSVLVRWRAPLALNGLIRTYRIDYQLLTGSTSLNTAAVTSVRSVTVAGSVTGARLSGLTPFSEYRARVRAANSAGDVTSEWSRFSTQQGSPEKVNVMEVERVNDGTAVILRWSPPVMPNGVITGYAVYSGLAGVPISLHAVPVYQGTGREFELRGLRPFTEYDARLGACTVAGCTYTAVQRFRTAEVTPGTQPAPSLMTPPGADSATITWRPTPSPNGNILLYEVLRRRVLPASTRRKRRQASVTTTEVSPATVVYQTPATNATEYSYTDSALRPYTSYQYQVRASNSRGATPSDWLLVRTAEAPPTGQSAPRISHVAGDYTSLLVVWSAPAEPNGVLTAYQISRDQQSPRVLSVNAPLEYTDSGLSADTVYSYSVSSCTAAGCTASLSASLRTMETAPVSVLPPRLTALSATEIFTDWDLPALANGRLSAYRLYMNSELRYVGLARTYSFVGLTPYTLYRFILGACTAGGCTNSSEALIRTLEAPPSGLAPPQVLVTGPTSVDLSWRPPTSPNGVISAYEVRRNQALLTSTPLLSYGDGQVSPGQRYSYTVTAYNARGSVTSDAVVIRTASVAPEGLAPPQVRPTGATAVRATWAPPATPNGEIYNYTLLQDGVAVFSERLLRATVTGLQPWTEHEYRVQACTESGCTISSATTVRTLESSPTGLAAPTLTPLSNSDGGHAGIDVTWIPPQHANGIILGYDLYRRLYTNVGTVGVRAKVYNGSNFFYNDRSSVLRPVTQYEYMVITFNSQGQANSPWSRTRTLEGIPESVLAPVVESVSNISMTLSIPEPLMPNGFIREFRVFLDNQMRMTLTSRSSLVILGGTSHTAPLTPYTEYTLHLVACTSAGCATSPRVEARTLASAPSGQGQPTIFNVTDSAAEVRWSDPTSPNGPITEFELTIHQSCPHPYADSTDGVLLVCAPSDLRSVVKALVYSVSIRGLSAFTRYQIQLQARNTAGSLDRPPIVTFITRPSLPVAVDAPTLTPVASSSILIDWQRSFAVNGEVIRFRLYVDSEAVYDGKSTSHTVTPSDDVTTPVIYVTLTTDQGEASTRPVSFDRQQPGFIGTTPAPTSEAPPVGLPWFQEVGFVIGVCVAAVVLLILSLFICFCCYWRRDRTPGDRYREQRSMPRQKDKRSFNQSSRQFDYYTDHLDGSSISSEISQNQFSPQSTMRPLKQRWRFNSRRRSLPAVQPAYIPPRPPLPHMDSASVRSRSTVSTSVRPPLSNSLDSLQSALDSDDSDVIVSGEAAYSQRSHVTNPTRPEDMTSRRRASVWGGPDDQYGEYGEEDVKSLSGEEMRAGYSDEERGSLDVPMVTEIRGVRHDSGLHSLVFSNEFDVENDRPISVLKSRTLFTDTHL